jgi:hypothetical protein
MNLDDQKKAVLALTSIEETHQENMPSSELGL